MTWKGIVNRAFTPQQFADPVFGLTFLLLLRHELTEVQRMRRFPAETVDPSVSQTPRHCWIFAICDAVVLLWRPKFAVLHNTGAPTLEQWRNGPTSPQQRVLNLEHFYRDTKGWSAGPHLLIADDLIWTLTPLTIPGVHSPSWNAMSSGIEMIGDYDREDFGQGPRAAVAANTVFALATLHTTLSLDPRTLKFHREDPKTTHDCPGRNIDKPSIIARIKAAMGGDPPLGKIPTA